LKSGWSYRTVDEFADHCLGKMLDRAKNKGVPRPYLRNLNVRWFQFDLDDVLEMPFEDSEFERYTAKTGDLVVCEGGYPGRSAIWSGEPVFIQKALHRVRCHEPARAKWLMYFLFLSDLDGSLKAHFSGSGIQHFTGQVFRKLKVPLPPLAEQQRIVAILDEAFEGLALATANAEKNLKNARDILDSHIKVVFANRGPGWADKPLGDVCLNLDSRRVPITKGDRSDGDIPYYGASGVVDHVDDYIFDEDILLVSEDGANLLARTYPIAFSVSGKCWVNNHAHVLCFAEPVYQKLIEFYLNSISLVPYVSGMAQPKLNQKALNSILVPVPPVEDRAKIVSTLELLTIEVTRLLEIYRAKLAALAELKQSLLAKAFAGELT
jgi:type I restriction enzyme S subunit